MQSSQPAFFKQGPKAMTHLVVFSLLSIILVVVDSQTGMLQKLRKQLSIALYPMQRLATAPAEGLRKAQDFLTVQSDLLAENRRLNDIRLNEAALRMRVHALESENAHLRDLQVARRKLPQPTILAEVLYSGRDPFSAQLIVDRGEYAGLQPGQVVIDDKGIVGQVVRVQPLTSEVRLLSDYGHMVPVVNERNQLRTVIYGMGRHKPLEVRNLAPNVDIHEGDVLSTSGIDGLYPVGLPVARVIKVERSAGTAFARIFCQPIAAIDQYRFLMIMEPAVSTPPRPEEVASAPAAAPKKKKGR